MADQASAQSACRVTKTLTVHPGQQIELPDGGRLTSDGWRLRDGSLYLFITVPKAAT